MHDKRSVILLHLHPWSCGGVNLTYFVWDCGKSTSKSILFIVDTLYIVAAYFHMRNFFIAFLLIWNIFLTKYKD